MKTIFFKKMMPFTFVLFIGTAGAFLTTSMQKSSNAAPKDGYITDQNNKPCNQRVSCSTNFNSQLCRISYPSGEQAKGKVNNNCDETLYRPSN